MTCPTCQGAGELSREGSCQDPTCPRRARSHPAHTRCATCGGHGCIDEHKPGCDGPPCFCGHQLQPSYDLFAPEALYPPGWQPPAP